MLPILRAFAFVPLLVAARIRREERKLVEGLRASHALDSERAVTLDVDGMLRTWVFERLVRNGVIRNAGDRVFFEESGYSLFRYRRRRRAAIVVAVGLVGFAIAVARGGMRL